MTQVKARLLKLNGLYGDNSEDSSDDGKNVLPPRPPKKVENPPKM